MMLVPSSSPLVFVHRDLSLCALPHILEQFTGPFGLVRASGSAGLAVTETYGAHTVHAWRPQQPDLRIACDVQEPTRLLHEDEIGSVAVG